MLVFYYGLSNTSCGLGFLELLQCLLSSRMHFVVLKTSTLLVLPLIAVLEGWRGVLRGAAGNFCELS